MRNRSDLLSLLLESPTVKLHLREVNRLPFFHLSPQHFHAVMIATAFIDKCSNELWEEIYWLESQPITVENATLYDEILAELRSRESRRQYLIDNF